MERANWNTTNLKWRISFPESTNCDVFIVKLGGGFKYVSFSSLLGEIIKFSYVFTWVETTNSETARQQNTCSVWCRIQALRATQQEMHLKTLDALRSGENGRFTNIWVFPKLGYPKMDGLTWKTLFFNGWFGGKTPYFWKRPYGFDANVMHSHNFHEN